MVIGPFNRNKANYYRFIDFYDFFMVGNESFYRKKKKNIENIDPVDSCKGLSIPFGVLFLSVT